MSADPYQYRATVLLALGTISFLAFLIMAFLRVFEYPVSDELLFLLLGVSSALLGIDFGLDLTNAFPRDGDSNE